MIEPLKNQKLELLEKELNGKGIFDYPFLSKDYSINSGMPCDDFTDWIVKRIEEQDWSSIGELLIQITKAPSKQIGVTINPANFEISDLDTFRDPKWIIPIYEQFRKIDFAKYISSENQAFNELLAILIIMLKEGDRKFFVFEKVELLTNALCNTPLIISTTY